jgi:hypothetical protein
MDIDPAFKPSIFIIIILAIILVVLYIFHIMKNKNQNVTNDCKCDIKPEIKHEINNEKTQSNTLTLYYTNWCGYSKQFLPDWKKIKEKINSGELGKNITTAEYECSEKKEICEKNKIHGYPSIILHKTDGTAVNFPDDQPRNFEAIIQFTKKNS